MRGAKLITAATIVSELGEISRFRSPRQLMAYAGMVSSEHSSGGKVRRGSITKAGNAHLRRVIIEMAWHYRHAPGVSGDLRKRQTAPAPGCTIAWNAQQRLNKRYHHLLARGKTSHQTAVAVGRELLGFIWAIACVVKATSDQPAATLSPATMSLTHQCRSRVGSRTKRDAPTHVPPRFAALSRRSGCSPALPYPPLRPPENYVEQYHSSRPRGDQQEGDKSHRSADDLEPRYGESRLKLCADFQSTRAFRPR
jgi:hypothetical protein